jgi:hypothetical protein
MLEYWLYRSRSVATPRSIDDAMIYLQACNRNPAHGITGYLHREDRCYAQYIEGPAASLRKLHRQILGDCRHRDIETLAAGKAGGRRFAGWDMAFSTEEMASFADFRKRPDRTEALRHASPSDVLDFMADTALRYEASGLAPNRPHETRDTARAALSEIDDL